MALALVEAGLLRNGVVGLLADKADTRVIEGKVTLQRTTVRESAGIAVAVSQSSGFLSGSTLSGNLVGVHVQDGSTLQEGDQPSGEPLELTVAPDTRFVDNGSRVGAGVVPLPGRLPSP
ncbi:MAG: hypothetical protein HYZ28_09600 [Myxococcales bacterium]|nr:hypothetical protein [Myxococcales bacterium]